MGGFDGCESLEFGCTTETNPLGLLLGFIILCIIYVVFNSIKDSISDRNRKKWVAKREESDRNSKEKRNAELKKAGLLTSDEIDSLLENTRRMLEKSKNKNAKKKAAKRKPVKKKTVRKKTVKRKSVKKKNVKKK